MRVNVSYTTQDGMSLLGGNDGDPRALTVIAPVVPDPALAENLMAEPGLVVLAFKAVVIFVERIVLSVVGVVKTVRGGAQTDDGTGAVQISVDVLHLFRGQRKEPGEEDQSVGILQDLQAGNIGRSCRNLAILVHTKQHRAVKPMVHGQDPGQCRQRFFGSVFMIAGHEHQFLSVGRLLRSVVNGTGKSAAGQ